MNHKTKVLMLWKKPLIFKRMRKVLLVLALSFQLSALSVLANSEKYKIGVSYQIPKSQSIQLRVTKIPTEYPWIERESDWTVKLPEIGSNIIAENVEDIKLTDSYGGNFTIPAGSKFYAKLSNSTKPKSFWRKGHAELSFYKLEINGNKPIDLSQLEFNSKDHVNVVGDSLKNIATTGALTVAGAVALPLMVFHISSFAGMSMLSNPYALGGAAALGGGIGLVYGIKRQGKAFIIEPGTELTMKIDDPWLISKQLESATSEEPSVHHSAINDKFRLEVLDVKKAQDEFQDTCLRISIVYDNKTGEELRYTSFQLLDSMGKEYEPSISSFDSSVFGELPKQGKLDLYFASDFPNTIHKLRVLRYQNQKVLAEEKIVLKK